MALFTPADSKEADAQRRLDYCFRATRKFMVEQHLVLGPNHLMPLFAAMTWEMLLVDPSFPAIQAHALALLLADGIDAQTAHKRLPEVVAEIEAELAEIEARDRRATARRSPSAPMRRTRPPRGNVVRMETR